jgi:hypothetical protein
VKLKAGIVGRTVDAVAAEWELDPEAIWGTDRTAPVSEARAVCFYLVRKLTSPSFSKSRVGLEFSKDHSSVITALRKIESRLHTEETLRERVARARKCVQSLAAGDLSALTARLNDVDNQIRVLIAKRTILNQEIERALSGDAPEQEAAAE